jgi:hypothetical protein
MGCLDRRNHGHVRGHGKPLVCGKFLASIPCQALTQLLRKPARLGYQGLNNIFSALVLHFTKHGESGASLDHRSNATITRAYKQVSFLMPRQSPVFYQCRAFSNRNRIDNVSSACDPVSGIWRDETFFWCAGASSAPGVVRHEFE